MAFEVLDLDDNPGVEQLVSAAARQRASDGVEVAVRTIVTGGWLVYLSFAVAVRGVPMALLVMIGILYFLPGGLAYQWVVRRAEVREAYRREIVEAVLGPASPSGPRDREDDVAVVFMTLAWLGITVILAFTAIAALATRGALTRHAVIVVMVGMVVSSLLPLGFRALVVRLTLTLDAATVMSWSRFRRMVGWLMDPSERAALARRRDNPAQAAPYYREMLKHPQSRHWSVAMEGLGWIAEREGDLTRAARCYRASLYIDPTNERALRGLAEALADNTDHVAYATELQELADHHSERMFLYRLLGV